MDALFVIGTDTGVGKTMITGLFGRYLQERKYRVVTQKWVQTGSRVPEDVYTHLSLMKIKPRAMRPYLKDMAPYVFAYPASAHLAARRAHRTISSAKITAAFAALTRLFEFVIVEGIGGALVPLNRKSLVIDIAVKLRLPVLIVANNKLGAVNHTLLTIEAIRIRGLNVVGVVMNSPQNNQHSAVTRDNPQIIQKLSQVPVLGLMPWSNTADEAVRAFRPIGSRILTRMNRRKYG